MKLIRESRNLNYRVRPARLALGVCVLVGGFVITTRAWLAPQAEGQQRGAVVAADKIPTGRELVVVRPWGFEPNTLTRPSGPFIFAVRNASGLRELSLRLDTEIGSRLQEKRMQREKLDWRATLDLPPGTYFLTAEGHESWVYRLIITER